MKFVSIFLLVVLYSFASNAQRRKPEPTRTKDEVLREKILSFGITTNTNSPFIGGFVVTSSTTIGEYKGKPKQQYIAIEGVMIKSPIEKDLPGYENKFVYGKVNYLTSIRPEYGREWYFFNKDTEKSIGLSGIIAGGPSFGILKPYYVKYYNKNADQVQTQIFDPNITGDINSFSGSASFFKGLFNNLKFDPGVHLKAALNFDNSTFGDKVSGVELGGTFEYFFKEPQIMHKSFGKNQKAYTSVYITLYFGSKK